MPKPKQREPAGLGLRLEAASRLADVTAGHPFRPFSSGEIADSRDRALANRLVTVALRRRGQIDAMVAELLERGLPRKAGGFEPILRIALAQLVFLPELGAHSAVFLAVEALKRDAKGQHQRALLNAVLRRAQGNAARYWSLPDELLIPDTLRTGWTEAYGVEAVAAFAAALIEGAPLDLTVKTAEDGETVGASPVMADTVRLESRDRPVEALPGFAEGRWWAQDAASAIPARLLDLPPGSRVLDMCAAPGGKTAQLAKAGYAVTALDSDGSRLERLNANLARLDYSAEIVTADATSWRGEAPFDAVLLDAPCSATGTFRRHPEVLWRQDAAASTARIALQQRMIANAAANLRPGGTLLYCVCALEPAEGEDQAAWATANVDGLEPYPIAAPELAAMPEAVTAVGHVRTHPGMVVPGLLGGTLDGFFVARFRHAAG